MPDTDPLDTLDTNASAIRLERFEAAWLAWRPGQPAPSWRDHLPAEGQPCSPDLIFSLVRRDIECRVKAGLPALLTERYFEHPRLQQTDARLEAEQHVGLIRREYRQRWESGQRAQRADFESAFPQHAAALSDLKPLSRCRQCGKTFPVDETWPAVDCPDCEGGPSVTGDSPPYVASATQSVAAPTDLDLRDYQLMEQLGRGGMGEVYRCNDPALGRDLAIKVMKAALRHDPAIERRFLREARITGSLQHPGIVAVHNLGRLADGRLHYTMRLVRGRTFADILKEDAGKPERLPALLGIFENICQAVAYAHSKRVIHRDLKPANVMVGRFGEVQVMDWGLAKLLSPDGGTAAPEETIDAATTRIATESADTPADLSRMGSGMGTPAYMPPEQALGEWDTVDERADVFALGSILCEMLTGQPAYSGGDGDERLRRARRGDMTEALVRLAQCGADATLVELCRECLALERRDRPRDAGAVAKRIGEYQAEVQDRLRRAELERVAAETRAKEEKARTAAERRARRRTLALAAAMLVLVAGGGGGFWWRQWKQSRDDETVNTALAQVELLEQQAQADPLQTDKYRQVLDAARAVAKLAQGASEGPHRRAEMLLALLQQEEEAARKDRELLSALLDVYNPREGPEHTSDAKGMMFDEAEPTADEQFTEAFRRWGLDLDDKPASEAAAVLKARPAVVVAAVIAALDEWASERRRQGKPKVAWRHLAALAELLDDDPGSKRRELREILARDQLPLERALSVLSAVLRPVPVPVEVPLGRDRLRLRQLADQTDPAAEPVLGLLTLTRALRVAGEEALAERLLRAALTARPREVVLYHALGQLLIALKPPRWAEVVECYAAARALRPDLGVRLATALQHSGRAREGLALLARLVGERPDNPYLHLQQGVALYEQRKYAEAEAACRKAVALQPDYARAYNNLGAALDRQGEYAEAEAAYRKAVALQPDYARAYTNLGITLDGQGKHGEAEAAYHKAIAVKPDYAEAYVNLGSTMRQQGKPVEAEAACRQAIALKPDYALAYFNLGAALDRQGKYAEAEAAYRKAIALKPDLAEAYVNLGAALARQGEYSESEAAYRKAIALKSDSAEAHCNLGGVLQRQGQFTESLAAYRRGHELGSKQSGWSYPSHQWVREAERLVELDKKLPAILQGEVSPANSDDAIALAEMCQQYKQRHVSSTRLYAEAFTAQPNLAADLNQQHRYNATCSAALAAAGQGEDARLLPDKVVAMFRRWALGWLRDDLTAYTKLAGQSKPAVKQFIQQQLTHWRSDPDLASVREPQALDRLPNNERAAWQALWRDVDELAKRVAKKDESKKGRKEPETPKTKP
jgi:serine/threonine-protein kinase